MNYKFLILLRNVSYIGHAIYLKLCTEKKKIIYRFILDKIFVMKILTKFFYQNLFIKDFVISENWVFDLLVQCILKFRFLHGVKNTGGFDRCKQINWAN